MLKEIACKMKAKQIDKEANVRNCWVDSWKSVELDCQFVDNGKEKTVRVRLGDSIAKVDRPGIAMCTWCCETINYSSSGRKSLENHVKTMKHSEVVKARLTCQSLGLCLFSSLHVCIVAS
jgi:hypothetical protein